MAIPVAGAVEEVDRTRVSSRRFAGGKPNYGGGCREAARTVSSSSRHDGSVFTTDDRDRVRDRVLHLASTDSRVVAGAVLGSLADDDGDQWSDLDLMFAVANECL